MPMLAKSFRLALTGLLLLSLALASGCRGPQKPDPSMTAVRGSGFGGAGASGDWVNPDAFNAGADALGLAARDASLMQGDANRLKDLFSPVYFDFDQSFIRPSDRGTLQEAATYLAANPTHRLLVEGHCDWRGTTEYNMALGDRRATSVTGYLEQLGVSGTRMEIVSKGDLEASTEGSEAQMQLDRRADLIVLLP